MGLFGGTKIYVSSVSVNLAGDYAEVPNYLKTLICGNIITGSRQSMSELLSSSYLGGPGSKLRQFFRSAGYGHYAPGIPLGGFAGMYNVTPTTLYNLFISEGILVDNGGGPAYSEVGPANLWWWAVEALTEVADSGFAPGGTANWTWDYDPATNAGVVHHPTYGDVPFTPANYDPNATYAHCLAHRVYVEFDPVAGRTVTHEWQVGRYKFGSGNATLDALTNENLIPGYQFWPHIPIRISNQFVSDTYYPTWHRDGRKVFRRIFGTYPDKLIKQLEDHPNLEDMDYAYIMFGVGPDTKDQACLEYLYRFFLLLRDGQYSTMSDLDEFHAAELAYKDSVAEWNAWDAGGRVGDPPGMTDFPTGRDSGLRVQTGITGGDLNIEMRWRHIYQETGSGLAKPGAKAGELWFEYPDLTSPIDSFIGGTAPVITQYNNVGEANTGGEKVRLVWQRTDDTWTALEIYGMIHRNFVYIDKYVEVRLIDALNDPQESGFVVPLHKPTTDAMGLMKFTQMTSSCCYLVINCFKIVKTSFLSGLLGIFFFVAAIVLLVVLPPAGGLLGTNLAVGTAVGLTATAAVIAGIVINAIAALILTKIITMVSVEILGEKWGQIIGAIVGFVATITISGLSNGLNISQIWSSMGSAVNLLALTNAVGSGISGYVQAAIKDVYADMAAVQDKYNEGMKSVEAAWASNLGYGAGAVDPMSLTDTIYNVFEPSSQFLTRTLLTGSDIAEISLGMIGGFTELTLTNNLPGQG